MSRFHFTCLYCRWRRRQAGKYSTPSHVITYQYKWSIHNCALVNEKGQILMYKRVWRHIIIDPRGHFTALRCAIIVTLDKIMQRGRRGDGLSRYEKVLLNVSELFANYPTW